MLDKQIIFEVCSSNEFKCAPDLQSDGPWTPLLLFLSIRGTFHKLWPKPNKSSLCSALFCKLFFKGCYFGFTDEISDGRFISATSKSAASFLAISSSVLVLSNWTDLPEIWNWSYLLWELPIVGSCSSDALPYWLSCPLKAYFASRLFKLDVTAPLFLLNFLRDTFSLEAWLQFSSEKLFWMCYYGLWNYLPCVFYLILS